MFKNYFLKRLSIILFTGFCIFGYIAQYTLVTAEDIKSGVIRFHVVANSNEKKDQELKLKVRDDVLYYISYLTEGKENISDVRNIIISNLQNIANYAEKAVRKNNFNYKIKVSLETKKFPLKSYEDIKFPGGKYEALCIYIGENKGKNWWCVLYPNLCFDTQSKSISMSESNKKILKNSLTEDEYKLLTSKNTKYNFKFQILEFFEKFIDI